MNIVQIIPQLASGGAERLVVDLANELSTDNEVSLIISLPLNGSNAFYLSEVSERVRVYNLNKKLGIDIGYLWRLFRLLKRLKPDVIHTHVSAFTHIAVLKPLFPSVRFIHTVHSEARFEASGRVAAYLRRVFFKRSWCVPVTIGKNSFQSFKDYYGIDAPMVVNGRAVNMQTVREKELIPPYDGLNLVSIGHISRVKNHLLMCRAVKKLADEGAHINLYMFGRNVDENIVRDIRALQSPNIHLLGEVKNPMMYLQNADIFCMTSIREGLPISLIEAISCGLIPVCTPVGSIVDIVKDSDNGFLSESLEFEQYVDALRRCISLSDDERRRMKTRNLELSKQFSMSYCAEQYKNIYQDAIISKKK